MRGVDFLRLTSGKVFLAVLLLFLPIGRSGDGSVIIGFWTSIGSVFTNASSYGVRGFLGLIIWLVGAYLVSCLIFWMYKKLRGFRVAKASRRKRR